MTGKLRQNVRYFVALLAVTVGFGTALVLAGAEAGASSSQVPAITGGQTLTDGSTLESPDGHYEAVLSSGVLSDRISGGRTLWSVGTSVPGSYAVLQPNGSLVIFGPSGQVDWDSATTGTGCPVLEMQYDGNLVDYDTAAIWSAKSTVHGMASGDELQPGWNLYPSGYAYQLKMGTNGDLVLHNDSGTEIWRSDTFTAGSYAAMQTDGDFVVTSPTGKAVWSTKTEGNPGATLALGTNGDLVVESTAGKALWSSGSTGQAGTGSPFAVTVASASATACPASVAAPTTTVTQTQTQTQTVVATQTVLVPTTTVVTVAVPAPSRELPRVDVKLTVNFGFKGASTFLRQIAIGKLPRSTELTIDYNPHLRRHKPKVRHATTARALKTVLTYLRRITYRPGQTLNLNLTRHGYEHEWATFTFRSGKLPTVRPIPTRR